MEIPPGLSGGFVRFFAGGRLSSEKPNDPPDKPGGILQAFTSWTISEPAGFFGLVLIVSQPLHVMKLCITTDTFA
jgi:hypothetical protein